MDKVEKRPGSKLRCSPKLRLEFMQMSVGGITSSEVIKQGCGLVCFGLAFLEIYEFSNKYSDEERGGSLKNFCFDYSVAIGYALTGATTPLGIKTISFVVHKILSDVKFSKINPDLSSFMIGGFGYAAGTSGVVLVLPLIFKDLFIDRNLKIASIHTFCNICIAPISLYYAALVWKSAKSIIFKD